MLLKGKNAVITGCLQGIGNATMRQFAKEGANIWAGCQYEKKEVFEEIEQLQEEYGVWIKPLIFDLTKPEEIKTAVKEVFTSKLPVDALVNIAGMTHNALFMMTSLEDFRRVFEIDFFSQMQFSQQIVKIMTRRGGGSIVNISSITGIDGNAGQVAYRRLAYPGKCRGAGCNRYGHDSGIDRRAEAETDYALQTKTPGNA